MKQLRFSKTISTSLKRGHPPNSVAHTEVGDLIITSSQITGRMRLILTLTPLQGENKEGLWAAGGPSTSNLDPHLVLGSCSDTRNAF